MFVNGYLLSLQVYFSENTCKLKYKVNLCLCTQLAIDIEVSERDRPSIEKNSCQRMYKVFTNLVKFFMNH